MYIENQGRPSVYSSGRGTCISVEIGDGVTQIMSIHEGKYAFLF
jgi:hypothetical protein